MNEINMGHLFFSGIVGGIIVASIVLIYIQTCGLRRGKFDKIECGEIKCEWGIECSELKVVGKWDRKARVILTTDLRPIDPREGDNNGERVIIYGDETGANVILWGADTDADPHFGMVTLRASEDGGRMTLGHGEGSADVWLGVQEHGGYVHVYGKDGASTARLGIDEHGGNLDVSGKKWAQVWLGIKEYEWYRRGEHVYTRRGGRVSIQDESGSEKNLNVYG